ncbi:hypothetical protein AAFF_G00192740 [Aldrovandia affinis]|uniref:Uncharacterized protein n=1 Tax=Aldrovandia affinis TaxID=143900 RepID=A0AAD7RIU2_9TELE|nr:hypothetical protein AAFF_G00192740 [Aldrovandia affinis]
MYHGEIFAYPLYWHRELTDKNVEFLCSDVACRYFPCLNDVSKDCPELQDLLNTKAFLSLKTKLDRIKPSLKFSKPLVDAIQLGLKNRFSEILEDPELIAAAILLPKFKTSWTKDEAILKKGLDYINLDMEPLMPLDDGCKGLKCLVRRQLAELRSFQHGVKQKYLSILTSADFSEPDNKEELHDSSEAEISSDEEE